MTAEAQVRKVAGYCPMGCGQTLLLDADGRVVCSYLQCPDPGIVDTILGENEPHHIVVLHEEHYSIVHPLRERKEHELLDCPLHRWLEEQEGPPSVSGRYRVRAHEGGWAWESLP